MEQPLISIIVPVYNVQPYLECCLSSLAEQTYTNVEIILVNDGSTDQSAHICRRTCDEDKRFRLIEQENQGLGPARNAVLLSLFFLCFLYRYLIEDSACIFQKKRKNAHLDVRKKAEGMTLQR